MNTPASPKEAAIAFLQLAASGQVDEAFSRFIGPMFRHHNPYFACGADPLRTAMRENATRFPEKAFDIQRAIAEGPLVAVHSRIRMKPGASSVAVVHVFRFDGMQIAELWDIGQPEPEALVNEDGMF